MTIRELMYESMLHNHDSLTKLIEFLVIEKETVRLEDDAAVLDLYFKPKNKDKMNKLLGEYMQKSEG